MSCRGRPKFGKAGFPPIFCCRKRANPSAKNRFPLGKYTCTNSCAMAASPAMAFHAGNSILPLAFNAAGTSDLEILYSSETKTRISETGRGGQLAAADHVASASSSRWNSVSNLRCCEAERLWVRQPVDLSVETERHVHGGERRTGGSRWRCVWRQPKARCPDGIPTRRFIQAAGLSGTLVSPGERRTSIARPQYTPSLHCRTLSRHGSIRAFYGLVKRVIETEGSSR